MIHFLKKNKHHFGLWALSGLVLLWSVIWLNSLEKKTREHLSPQLAAQIITASSSLLSANNRVFTTKNIVASDVIQVLPPAKEPASFSSTSLAIGQEEQKNLVTFQFINPSGEKKFQASIVENETVYQVMLRLKEKQGLIFEVKDYSGLGAFVESIDGLSNNPKKNQFWIYYLNGKAAIAGVSLTKLHYNDLITWHYEDGKF